MTVDCTTSVQSGLASPLQPLARTAMPTSPATSPGLIERFVADLTIGCNSPLDNTSPTNATLPGAGALVGGIPYS